jgi:hypothetical protein
MFVRHDHLVWMAQSSKETLAVRTWDIAACQPVVFADQNSVAAA